MHLTQCSKHRANFVWVMLLLVMGIFYISNTWTPSSYGGPIKYFGVSDRGIVAGTPRGHRSDEWGVATPLTQATVNNDLGLGILILNILPMPMVAGAENIKQKYNT